MEKEKDISKVQKPKEPKISFIIASDVLKQMFEGKNEGKAGEVLDQMKEMSDKGIKVRGIIPMSSFLRAIFLADPNVSIQKIQKSLSFLQIVPGFADFKDKDAVIKELMDLANAISNKQKDKGEKNVKKD